MWFCLHRIKCSYFQWLREHLDDSINTLLSHCFICFSINFSNQLISIEINERNKWIYWTAHRLPDSSLEIGRIFQKAFRMCDDDDSHQFNAFYIVFCFEKWMEYLKKKKHLFLVELISDRRCLKSRSKTKPDGWRMKMR